jgi:hypothetical protein
LRDEELHDYSYDEGTVSLEEINEIIDQNLRSMDEESESEDYYDEEDEEGESEVQ